MNAGVSCAKTGVHHAARANQAAVAAPVKLGVRRNMRRSRCAPAPGEGSAKTAHVSNASARFASGENLWRKRLASPEDLALISVETNGWSDPLGVTQLERLLELTRQFWDDA